MNMTKTLVIKIAVRKVPASGFHKMLYLASLFKMDQKIPAINCDLRTFNTFSDATQRKNNQILGFN